MAVKVQTYPLVQCRRRVIFCYKVQATAAVTAAAMTAAVTAMESQQSDSASESPQVLGLLGSVTSVSSAPGSSASSESEQPIGDSEHPRLKRQKTHGREDNLGQPTIVLLLGSVGDVGSKPRLAEFQQDRCEDI